MTASGPEYLVAFDVDAIKDYVFAPVRPLHIAGGSRIVEHFTRNAAEDFKRHPEGRQARVEPVYAGGGSGLFVVESDAAAERFARWLEDEFPRRTDGGGSCTTALVSLVSGFQQSRKTLEQLLTLHKDERELYAVTQDVVPAGEPPCQACGREVGDEVQVPEADENAERYVGKYCKARRVAYREARKAGEAPEQAETLEHLENPPQRDGSSGGENDRERRRSALAMVYLDLDNAGEHVRDLGCSELGSFATELQRELDKARDKLVEELKLERSYLAPVIGGDDLLFFLDARHAAVAVELLWSSLAALRRKGQEHLTFSAGIALGPTRMPLGVLQKKADEALREAKDRRKAGSESEPWVAVTTLLGGRLHAPSRPLFGGPVPQSRWSGAGSVGALVAALKRVGKAQLAGLAADLAQPSAELAWLDIEYRQATASQREERDEKDSGPAIGEAVMLARELAGALGTDPAAVLKGGLLCVETFDLWGAASAPAQAERARR